MKNKNLTVWQKYLIAGWGFGIIRWSLQSYLQGDAGDFFNALLLTLFIGFVVAALFKARTIFNFPKDA